MRTEKEIMKLILDKAKTDDRIRAAFIQGSRVDPAATHDRYCDYDIGYIVRDIKSFTEDDSWIEYFGEMLILQKPEDWYSHPYDYNGTQKFVYLMQFMDGNRIDLSLTDIESLQEVQADMEPRIVLLDKDGIPGLMDNKDNSCYYIKKPSEKEFFDCNNEFWWLSVYIAKGLCREELLFVKEFMECNEMEMFLKMLNWSIGIDNNFSVSTGKCSKYVKRYLSKEEMDRLTGIFSNGTYEDIWDKLFKMCEYFDELSVKVSRYFGYTYNKEEASNVTQHLKKMKQEK